MSYPRTDLCDLELWFGYSYNDVFSKDIIPRLPPLSTITDGNQTTKLRIVYCGQGVYDENCLTDNGLYIPELDIYMSIGVKHRQIIQCYISSQRRYLVDRFNDPNVNVLDSVKSIHIGAPVYSPCTIAAVLISSCPNAEYISFQTEGGDRNTSFHPESLTYIGNDEFRINGLNNKRLKNVMNKPMFEQHNFNRYIVKLCPYANNPVQNKSLFEQLFNVNQSIAFTKLNAHRSQQNYNSDNELRDVTFNSICDELYDEYVSNNVINNTKYKPNFNNDYSFYDLHKSPHKDQKDYMFKII